jgi:drug/metabolite transporter (DMT)-like permease
MPSDSQGSTHPVAPHLALIAVQILFGTWPVLGKFVLRSMSSSLLVASRLTGAAIVFLIIQGNIRPLLQMRRRDLLLIALSSGIGVVGNQFLYVKGLSLTTAINATLISTTIPVFTLLVSIVFGYDQLSLRRVTGMVLAIIGVLYLVNPFRGDFSTQTTIGNILIVSNSLLYGTYIVISKDLFERYGALNVITWIFLAGIIVTIPVGVVAMRNQDLQSISGAVWLSVAVVILLPTVGAYYLNAWALTKVPPSIVAVYIYLQPLIAFGLAPVLLGETWNSRTIVSSILIFAGVAIVTRRGRSLAIREISEHPDALAR